MDKEAKKKLEDADIRFVLRINDVPVVIMVADDVCGCFEIEELHGMDVTVCEIKDPAVRQYATLIAKAIILESKGYGKDLFRVADREG